MSRDKLGHLEHAHLALAVEYRPERVISVDLSSLLFILQTMPLDIIPKLFRKLRTGQRCRADDCGELIVGLDWSHEGGVGLAF